MNNRNRKNIQHPLITRILELNKFIIDKGTQSRKIVNVKHINYLLERANILFYMGLQYLNGIDTLKKMSSCLYDIQAGAFFVGFIEQSETRKRTTQNIATDGKKKKHRKHYGFDAHAVSFIDIMCDELLSTVSSYGQHPLGGDYK